MADTHYRVYKKRVFDLAKTMVVKTSMTAEAMNRDLSHLGYTLDDDPTTWKYYKNIAGEYHPFDRTMTVRSLDTLEDIPFDKQTLSQHPATREGYEFGTRFYNELVRRYPDQEMLILGILHPVDASKATAAPEGTILRYDESLVEENEYNLIPELEQWIQGFLTRWHNADYALIDDLYAPAVLGIMFSLLPQAIMTIRQSNCMTNRAHSYHIREYLASNARLDRYIGQMNKKQALFLYRNVRYLQNHAGKKQTQRLLIENILTERNIPLAAYDIRHNLGNQPDALDADFDVYPQVEMLQKPLNLRIVGTGTLERSVREVLQRASTNARDNAARLDEAEKTTTDKMKHSLINQLPTKMLESNMVDRSNARVFKFIDVALNNWLYLSANERYIAFITVDHPDTGEIIQLDAKDAFILYLYAYNKAIAPDQDFEYVPDAYALRVKRDTPPTFEHLRAMTNKDHISDELIEYVMDVLPNIGVYTSTTWFHDKMLELHEAMLDHRWLYAMQENMHARAQMENLIGQFYIHKRIALVDESTTYTQWLAARSIDLDGLNRDQYAQLFESLAEQAMGTDLDRNQGIRQLHASMMAIMEKLSSYTVQYLSNVNSDSHNVADWQGVRVAEVGALMRNAYQKEIADTNGLDAGSYWRSHTPIPLQLKNMDVETVFYQRHYVDGRFRPQVHDSAGMHSRLRVGIDNVRFHIPDDQAIALGEAIHTTAYEEYDYPDADWHE